MPTTDPGIMHTAIRMMVRRMDGMTVKHIEILPVRRGPRAHKEKIMAQVNSRAASMCGTT
uniref:Uncharacterized protein n=1 Tax=Arion vulgaris TaxID=1028688 RepID=A0A0B6YQX6_9EUPU